jgi:thiol-disulfide isomerase/thioredoxin
MIRNCLSFLPFSLLVLSACTASAQQIDRPKQARPRIDQGTLENGQAAPNFTLSTPDGQQEVQLSNLRGKPTVLIFGSCTCPPFVASLKAVEQLHAKYKDKVHFYLVYVREAHPIDGWALAKNQFQVKTPKTLAERQELATTFAEKLKLSIPVLVDSIDDKTNATYAGWPNRMVIVSADGKIADKGVAGPRGTAGSAEKAGETLDGLLNEQSSRPAP